MDEAMYRQSLGHYLDSGHHRSSRECPQCFNKLHFPYLLDLSVACCCKCNYPVFLGSDLYIRCINLHKATWGGLISEVEFGAQFVIYELTSIVTSFHWDLQCQLPQPRLYQLLRTLQHWKHPPQPTPSGHRSHQKFRTLAPEAELPPQEPHFIVLHCRSSACSHKSL
ncbi:hypothetical protein Q8A67_022831 [Cirrhinus molitorella]|uniref:Uncharacterized protein n=1 Tax=Cirrhinus molitorella TaxID=172907 RepID=A0AA88P8U2_9TELE|nr:hypothetical protein Q8A67_022831 [Cirrhinus molitorella]